MSAPLPIPSTTRLLRQLAVYGIGAALCGLALPNHSEAAMELLFHFRCTPDPSQEFSFTAEGNAQILSASKGMSPAQVSLSSLSLTTADLLTNSVSGVLESSPAGNVIHVQMRIGRSASARTDLDFQLNLNESQRSEVTVSSGAAGSRTLHSRCKAQPVCDWVVTQVRETERKIHTLEAQIGNIPKFVAEKLRARLDAVASSPSAGELKREIAHQRQVLSNFDFTIESEKEAISSSLTNERLRHDAFERETATFGCHKS